jgi:DNA-binding SARP family transcriptional activator
MTDTRHALELQLATAPGVHGPDRRLTPLAPRDAALLAWLAIEGPTARTRLAQLLWPDSEPEAARNTLRQRLFQLRRQFGDALLTGHATLALADGVTHDLLDADDVLADAAHDIGGEFGTWLVQQRERRRGLVRQSLIARCETAEQARDYAAALLHARELLALEPLSEEAHRRLMRLLYLDGDRAAALLAFDRCEQVLKDEVGATPSAETLDLLRLLEGARPPATLAKAAPRVPVALARPPRLVGRDHELALARAALEGCRRLVLVGEAGMGKSRLLAEIAQQLPGRGRPVLVVQARPGDAAVPYATLARCLRALLREVPQVLENAPRDELARLLPEIGVPASRSHDVQRVLLLGSVQAVLERAAEHIEALVLDDLHFIDEASAQLLRAALSGNEAVAGLPIALATRPESHAAADALVLSIEADAQAPRVLLAPLGEAALVELVESLALPELDARALAPQLLRHTGGNPLFVLETLKMALAGAAQGSALPLAFPAGVGQLIDRRLALLSADAIAIARLAAMAGVDFSIELAEQLLQTPALRLADAWNQLEAAQVLRGTQFAHDLVFEAVLRSVPAPIARHSHAALARWLEQHAGEPLRIARHWHEAGEPARTVAPLIEAARRSAERAFVADARAHLELASERARTLGLREQEFEALLLLHDNYALDDPGLPHDALLPRVDALARTDRDRLQARMVRCDFARRRNQWIDTAEVEADMARAVALGEADMAIEFGQVLMADYSRAGRPDAGLALLARHHALFANRPDYLADHEGNVSVALANLDRYAEAEPHILRAMALHHQPGGEAELLLLTSNHMRILRMQGRQGRALDLLESMDRWHADTAPNLRSWVNSRMGASEMLRGAGRYGQALVALAQQRDNLANLVGVFQPAWPVADAMLWLDLGQHTRALQAIDAVDAAAFRAAPAWLQARVCLARAQVGARVRGQGESDAPGDAEWARLNEAAALAPRDGRRATWFDVVLQRALWGEPDAGSALAEGLAGNAAALGMFGYARSAWWVACARYLDSGQLGAAQRCAEQSLALATQVFQPGQPAEPVAANSLPAMWVEALGIRLEQALGQPTAGERLARAQATLRTIALVQVPAEFRESYLHRNPVHRGLLALVVAQPDTA